MNDAEWYSPHNHFLILCIYYFWYLGFMKETERERKKVEGVEGVERVKVKPRSPRVKKKGFPLSNKNWPGRPEASLLFIALTRAGRVIHSERLRSGYGRQSLSLDEADQRLARRLLAQLKKSISYLLTTHCTE